MWSVKRFETILVRVAGARYNNIMMMTMMMTMLMLMMMMMTMMMIFVG